uniref:Uncharacterized protein n=1 Tax=Proboscia inermis TaxID=420281 RepID=A0A7S0GH82_9STRA|mmetsp:Transcript_34996/g.35202  ORF Transcript_34996/g.35202 Transcript_34996/m.35202 type:complete len:129 (+) Transcript_34996:341-727(+)
MEDGGGAWWDYSETHPKRSSDAGENWTSNPPQCIFNKTHQGARALNPVHPTRCSNSSFRSPPRRILSVRKSLVAMRHHRDDTPHRGCVIGPWISFMIPMIRRERNQQPYQRKRKRKIISCVCVYINVT